MLVRAEEATDPLVQTTVLLAPVGWSVSEVIWKDFNSSLAVLLPSMVKLKVLTVVEEPTLSGLSVLQLSSSSLFVSLFLLMDCACKVLLVGLVVPW